MPAYCSSSHASPDKIYVMQIEPRYVNLTETCFVAPPEKIAAACDKNTIGVVGILGTTYSGHYEDLAGIDKAVGESLSLSCIVTGAPNCSHGDTPHCQTKALL